ncbi:recombinase family protein [Rhizorhabdus argentea]|uniref:recombinase family protein n=1 Tax=Rhizorhabdus argentea TaxID=1387174 RepID=UPI0030EB85BD
MSIKAAQYVRMSTHHQRYSTSNQIAMIASYAATRNFEVVRTYVDEGRSGLKLAGRGALQALLSDVLSGAPGFDAVLVYDISRWGRFQDTDESAHYEWLVRNAGLSVHYCAEQFENDGSASSGILKSLKRTMAGEFSRELSQKVFIGQCRLAARGYKMGGRQTFGLRRVLVDELGNPKVELKPGQRKNISTDRVILAPGPPKEVAVVRRIYRMSIRGSLSDRQIADVLNGEGVDAVAGRKWTKFIVRQVLTSEVYTGAAIFNRRSTKLRSQAVRNPPEQWVRREHAFKALIDRTTFREAQRVRGRRRICRISEGYMLDQLRHLLRERGRLSTELINSSALLPAAHTYRERFGSLDRAYAIVGYYRPSNTPSPMSPLLVDRANAFAIQTARMIRQTGGRVRTREQAGILLVDGTIRLVTTLARYTAGSRENFWEVKVNRAYEFDFVLVGLMAEANEYVRAYYLLPVSRFPASSAIRLIDGGNRLERYRIPDLISVYSALRERAALPCHPN